MLKVAALLLVCVACKSDPPARQAPPSTRPASISDADVATVEQLLAKVEQLAKAVNAAGTDCAKAVAAIQATTTESAALLAETAQIDRRTRKDPAAESWAFAKYGVRMMKPMGQLVGGPCSKDAAYAAALQSLQR